jgi:lipopolysaccharide export system protein LptA
VRGRCERILVVAGALALLAPPAVALAKKQHDSTSAVPGAAAGPPDQTDLFQNLSLGSNKEPINITADGMELDYKGNVLTYTGNVKVVQGDATLLSDRLEITYDRQALQPAASPVPGGSPAAMASPVAAASSGPAASGPAASGAPKGLGSDADKIKQVVAEGHVRMQRGDRIAEGRHAVFDQAKQTIVLSDGAVLHEGKNQVTGDRIIFYLQDQRSVVESGSNSRVNAVFYPNAKPSTSPSSAASPRAAAPSPRPQASAGGR